MFATTPPPPYVAVVFSSRRTTDGADSYAAATASMEALAARQPGYLGIESARDPDSRFGITVSYWTDETAAHAWKRNHAHAAAQQQGRERWYEHYEVRIARVLRAYAGPGDARTALVQP